MAGFTGIDIALVVCAVYFVFRLVTKPKVAHPPGPKGYPIIGNLLDLPTGTERPWKRYAAWGAQYGGLIRVRVLNRNIIIVNDPEIASEMFDAKGTIYSGRPVPPMSKLCGFELILAFLQYTKRLREGRKLFNHVVGSTRALERFNPGQEYQSTMLIKRLLARPGQVEEALRKTSGSLILHVAYGYPVKEEGKDPLVDAANLALNTFGEISIPGRFLVDSVPILQYVPSWFPLAGFKKFAAESTQAVRILTDDSLKFVQKGIKEGNYTPSYVSELIAELGEIDAPSEQEKLDIIKWSAGTMYAAATDTTVSTLLGYFLAMMVYPEVQQKLQAEVDQVIGKDRLPTLQDRKNRNTPYVEAVVKELTRWLPAGPLSVPRISAADDIHKGYFIPKGSVIIPNSWHFLHDPERYHDPMSFKPERFLGPNPERDPYDFAFGYGRRVCPGMRLADMSLWIDVAKLAATMNITKPKTPDGKIIEPLIEQTPNLVSLPVGFKCHIEPRYAGVEELVEHTLAAAAI